MVSLAVAPPQPLVVRRRRGLLNIGTRRTRSSRTQTRLSKSRVKLRSRSQEKKIVVLRFRRRTARRTPTGRQLITVVIARRGILPGGLRRRPGTSQGRGAAGDARARRRRSQATARAPDFFAVGAGVANPRRGVGGSAALAAKSVEAAGQPGQASAEAVGAGPEHGLLFLWISHGSS